MVVGVDNADAARVAVLWATVEAGRRELRLRPVHALDRPVGAAHRSSAFGRDDGP